MKKFLALIFLLTGLSSGCFKKPLDIPSDGGSHDLTTMLVPPNFDYKTARNVNLRVYDNFQAGQVRYDIYNFESDVNNSLIGSGSPYDGFMEMTVTIPTSSNQIYLMRNHLGRFESTILDIGLSSEIEFTYTGENMQLDTENRSNCYGTLFAVNIDGELYQIDGDDDSYPEIQLASLEGGSSIGCAVDKANRICYYNTGTTLRYYDIDAGTYHVAQEGNPFGSIYSRMAYNHNDGFLYISRNEEMYVIDPLSNSQIASYTIDGMEEPIGGGDLAFDDDGNLYLCSQSGLYEISFDNGVAEADRISDEDLPFEPTGLAFGDDDKLFISTNDEQSQLIEMDKHDASWDVLTTYSHRINNLANLPCVSDLADDVDSDDDGIVDSMDDFPDNDQFAFETFTPSSLGWGSVAFEDLWPGKGDFDFNDLVMDYRFNAISNASNKIVKLECTFIVQNIGGSLTNGFGFQIDGLDPSDIESVTGANYTESIISLNDNGTEASQSDAVIIVFDNAFQNGNWGDCVAPPELPITIEIVFDEPMSTSDLGMAPFNPFIFVESRDHEIHLPDHKPTDLADTSIFGTGSDDSSASIDRYYKTSNGLPWAINIIHSFKHPLESNVIDQSYLKFVEWGESGGVSYPDWYKNNTGYRNNNLICTGSP